MAKVETLSRNNSSCFIVNDASVDELASLDISANSSSPKIEFDISSILQSDSEISLERQCFDKETSEILHLLSESVSVRFNSRKTVNSNMSLGAVAKNLTENNNRTLGELCFDGDINLTDVLFTYDQPAFVKNETDTGSNDSLNFLDLFLNTRKNAETHKFSKTPENDVHIENVSELVESCNVLNLHPTSSVSLDSLAANHILNNESNGSKNKFDENFSDSFVFNFENVDSNVFQLSDDCLDDISSKENQENKNISIDNCITFLNEHNSIHGFETCGDKHQSKDEALDSELVPDIDLSFCIKKNSVEKLSADMSSPESVDSGFDETDLVLRKFAPGKIEKSGFNTDGSAFIKDKLTCLKQSLLSRAISARPKIDDSRLAKLKKINGGLFSKQLLSSIIGCNQKKHSEISERIIDYSSECIQASFLIISHQNNLTKNAL